MTRILTKEENIMFKKSLQLLIIPLIVLLWIGCAKFPTSYSRIDPDKARLLDFIYEPAEAAPGDTVLLKAVFAGRTVTAEELTWRMSPKIIVNNYGVTEAIDTVPLEILPQACVFSDQTNCIAIRFVIPKNIIAESPLIPDNWTIAIPDYYRGHFPSVLLAKSKTGMLKMFENLSLPDSLASASTHDTTGGLLPMLLQCFTVQMRIYCSIANDHTIQSAYSVRYNSRFASTPAGLHVPINHNPRIDSVGVYVVRNANLSTFDPNSGIYSFDYFTMHDSGATDIAIDNNNTYFMATFVGNVDTTLSIDAAMGNGNPLPEQNVLQWYLQFNQQDMENVSAYDLATIDGNRSVAGQNLSRLSPSQNTAITTCTAWLEVSDQFLNEYYRPQGSTLKEMRIRFTYK
jgi:hypothetical protein